MKTNAYFNLFYFNLILLPKKNLQQQKKPLIQFEKMLSFMDSLRLSSSWLTVNNLIQFRV